MAFVLGLAPGRATEVPIVVVAEDGVTSLRYFLSIFRAPGRADSTRQAAPEPEVSSPQCHRCDAPQLGCLHVVAALTVAMSPVLCAFTSSGPAEQAVRALFGTAVCLS